MNAIDQAEAYLRLPGGTDENPLDLRWAVDGSAVEEYYGVPVALAEEIRLILSGVFGRPRVPPFAAVMGLIGAMKNRFDTPGTLSALARAYNVASLEHAAGVARNAGLLIRDLCDGFPFAVVSPQADAVAHVLGRPRREHTSGHGSAGWQWSDFESHVANDLRSRDDATCLHWLKFGCAPVVSDVPDVLELPAGRMPTLLDVARRRPRLVGAAVLVPAVEAATTLPARRRSADSLPQGGYADVTTHGDPARLLPGQFALDPDEFVRRFADRELLYFKREDPHTARAPERVIVVDQGVRTWGGVRLALAAGAIALLVRDRSKSGLTRLTATSAPDALDPTTVPPGDLADRLEASDLTPHPGETLGRVLEEPGTGPRDFVLLTHPRNLREPDILSAAVGLGRGDRLFAIVVDDRGQGRLDEWATHGWRAVRTFRLDLAAAEAARVEAPGPHRPANSCASAWSGDVEPIGFPFRPGLVNKPELIGFDDGGEWAVAVGADGVPHGMALDGTPPEVLPRAYQDGTVMKTVDAVVGVAGGVVLCGRVERDMNPPTVTIVSAGDPTISASATLPGPQGTFVAAHYDFVTRSVRLIPMGPMFPNATWTAYSDPNCVVVRAGGVGRAVDLATLGHWPVTGAGGLVSRAFAVLGLAVCEWPSPCTLRVVTAPPSGSVELTEDTLILSGNMIALPGITSPWKPFMPTSDGRPILAGHAIGTAVLALNTLATTLIGISGTSRRGRLVLFRGPDGHVVCDYPHKRGTPFALSPDGLRFVRRAGQGHVEVTNVGGDGLCRTVAMPAHLHPQVDVEFGTDEFWLVIRIGQFQHDFRLEDQRMVHSLISGPARESRWIPSSASEHSATDYDPTRFPSGRVTTWGPWRAVLDRLGQVVLFTAAGTLVAAFLIRRERFAAWLPTGEFWGDPVLIGGPPTTNVDRAFADAIRAAEGE